jgi:hypothetical protein
MSGSESAGRKLKTVFMNGRSLHSNLAVIGYSIGLLGAFALTGCSRSTDQPSARSTPDEVRGKPINAPLANSNTVQLAAKDQQSALSPARSVETSPASGNPVVPAAVQMIKALAATEAAIAQDGEFLAVGFEKLASFNFEMPEEPAPTNQVAKAKSKDQIPPAVKALDQKSVAIKGFMLPLKVESGLVTEMLIMRDQSMCCYGTVPKINEWVSVKMVDRGVKAVMDQPVTLYGKLRVGEMRENGYLVGIYQMDAQKMAGPADL